MTIKTALSVVALAAGLAAAPVMAQTAGTMIGSQTVAETDVAAVQGRCMDLRTQAETESLTAESADANTVETETSVAGDATITNEPALTESVSASAVDLALVTLEDCEAGGWFDM